MTVPQSQLAARARARSSAPAKLALLLAVPEAERSAAALIVDAIATEIVPPGELWAALRPVLARLAREAAGRVTDDSSVAPLGYAYAADVRLAARELERADARRSWAHWRGLRRRAWSNLVVRPHIIAGMRAVLQQFRGAP